MRHEEVEKGGGETRAANNVDEIMVGEVHSTPIEHADVRPHVRRGAIPKVSDEEGTEGRPAGVETGEGTKDKRGVGEGGLVAVAAKESVDTGEPARGAGDVVGGGGKTIDDFVPGGSTGNKNLDEDGGEVHVAKCLGPCLEGERGTEEPEGKGKDEWVCVVYDAIGEPSDDIQDGVRETGEDVGNVGAVENRFEGWEEDDVYSGAEIRGYKTVCVKSKEPGKDGCCWEEKLGGEWDEEGDSVEERDQEFGRKGGDFHDSEPEYGED